MSVAVAIFVFAIWFSLNDGNFIKKIVKKTWINFDSFFPKSNYRSHPEGIYQNCSDHLPVSSSFEILVFGRELARLDFYKVAKTTITLVALTVLILLCPTRRTFLGHNTAQYAVQACLCNSLILKTVLYKTLGIFEQSYSFYNQMTLL